MTAYQKPTKWRDWRDRFLYVKINDNPDFVAELSRLNTSPYHCLPSATLPPLKPEEWDVVNNFFKVKKIDLGYGQIPVPSHWLPKYEFFSNPTFLSVVGLSREIDKGLRILTFTISFEHLDDLLVIH